MFPNHKSVIKETDPDVIEIFDNWAFDEVIKLSLLDTKTRVMMTLAATIGAHAVNEYKIMVGAALNVGVSPVEIKEILYQSTAYVGMAKAFDYIHTTNEVFKTLGIESPVESQRISTFLGIPPKEIGSLSGTKKNITGKLDLAMIQSLIKIEDLTEIAQSYSQIIIDECHHIPAASFEDVMKRLPARYVVGLTATPYRKDGLEKILFQQCGPISYELEDVESLSIEKRVTIHETCFRMPDSSGNNAPYHELIFHLTSNVERNELIATHTLSALKESRFPLLISDRKEHLDVLALMVRDKADQDFEIVRLDGDLTNKQRKLALENLHSQRKAGRKVLLISTASLIGEGFDLPALDTMILATPLSFEGRMIQYAGRIHRPADGKTDVQMIDYCDFSSAMLVKMYRNRLKAYRQMGYSINEPAELLGPLGKYALAKNIRSPQT